MSPHDPDAAAGLDLPSSGRRRGLSRLLAFLLPVTTTMYALYQSIQQIMLPAQIESLAPQEKVGALALLTSLSALASMVALPFGGGVSDRTRSRFVRRTPWIIVSAFTSADLMVAMGLMTSLPARALLYNLALALDISLFHKPPPLKSL